MARGLRVTKHVVEAPTKTESRRNNQVKIIKWLAIGFMGLIVVGVIASSSSNSSTKTTTPTATTASTSSHEADKSTNDAPKKDAPKKPEMTSSQKNAVESAKSYLETKAFSKKGLIQQLSSSAGEGFPRADAVFAVNHIDVDWSEQAVKSAREYLDIQSFSKSGLIEQLSSSAGEGFTLAQAQYGVNKAY
jgi:flagellar biosynthesis GTPase FlhF